jgi:hypothetical protein
MYGMCETYLNLGSAEIVPQRRVADPHRARPNLADFALPAFCRPQSVAAAAEPFGWPLPVEWPPTTLAQQ